jgi:hypothetical protein
VWPISADRFYEEIAKAVFVAASRGTGAVPVQVLGQPEYVDDLTHGGRQAAQLHDTATTSKNSSGVQDWRQAGRVGEAHPSAIEYEPVDRWTPGAMQERVEDRLQQSRRRGVEMTHHPNHGAVPRGQDREVQSSRLSNHVHHQDLPTGRTRPVPALPT